MPKPTVMLARHKSIEDTEPRVQLFFNGHIPKGVWVTARLPAGTGLCVTASLTDLTTKTNICWNGIKMRVKKWERLF